MKSEIKFNDEAVEGKVESELDNHVRNKAIHSGGIKK
jgi:hypothetical protein